MVRKYWFFYSIAAFVGRLVVRLGRRRHRFVNFELSLDQRRNSFSWREFCAVPFAADDLPVDGHCLGSLVSCREWCLRPCFYS